jgi:hypothetical protein
MLWGIKGMTMKKGNRIQGNKSFPGEENCPLIPGAQAFHTPVFTTVLSQNTGT